MSSAEHQPNVTEALLSAVSSLNMDCSGISWSGVNLLGDRASINEVLRLMHCEARMIALQSRLLELQDGCGNRRGPKP